MSNYTLMLVDDDLDDQCIFMNALQQVDKNIGCICYGQAEKGIEDLKEGLISPKLIFLDLNMPIVDGFTFLSSVKSENQLKGIPVVIYSTSNRLMDKQKAKDLGAASFISKPDSLEDLRNVLRQVLQRY